MERDRRGRELASTRLRYDGFQNTNTKALPEAEVLRMTAESLTEGSKPMCFPVDVNYHPAGQLMRIEPSRNA